MNEQVKQKVQLVFLMPHPDDHQDDGTYLLKFVHQIIHYHLRFQSSWNFIHNVMAKEKLENQLKMLIYGFS